MFLIWYVIIENNWFELILYLMLKIWFVRYLKLDRKYVVYFYYKLNNFDLCIYMLKIV